MLFLIAMALGKDQHGKKCSAKPSVCLWTGVRREPEEEELCSPGGGCEAQSEPHQAGEEEFRAVEGSQRSLQDGVHIYSFFASRHMLIGKGSTITVNVDAISSLFNHLTLKRVCVDKPQVSVSEDDASEVHNELMSR